MNQEKIHTTEEAPGLSPSAGRRIFLVRHGVTEWNKSFRYQGSTDIPLSSEGREQARLTGKRFSKIKVDAIISSPLVRSMETAEIIGSACGVPGVQTLETLREVNFGDWEGLTVRGIVDRFGKETFEAWRDSQIDVTPSNGETPEAVFARAKQASDHICGMREENLIVVAHGAIFRALLLHLTGFPRSNIFWRLRMDNCSISLLNVDKHGIRSLSFFNDVTHLKIPENFIDILPL